MTVMVGRGRVHIPGASNGRGGQRGPDLQLGYGRGGGGRLGDEVGVAAVSDPRLAVSLAVAVLLLVPRLEAVRARDVVPPARAFGLRLPDSERAGRLAQLLGESQRRGGSALLVQPAIGALSARRGRYRHGLRSRSRCRCGVHLFEDRP